MNELEEIAINDIEHELEVSKQFPYLHKPREVAKQLVLRCGYGKVKEYQDEIARLRQDNAYWYGQANQNYEDCHANWTKTIARDILTELARDYGDIFTIKAINDIKRRYGLEVEE